jgi:hypothetical protein
VLLEPSKDKDDMGLETDRVGEVGALRDRGDDAHLDPPPGLVGAPDAMLARLENGVAWDLVTPRS